MVSDGRQLLVSLVSWLPPERSVLAPETRKHWLWAAECILDVLYEEKPKRHFDPYSVFAAGYIKSVSKEMRGNR